VEAFGHVNLGFAEKELQKFVGKAGLDIINCETVTRERRPPHFEVIALMARKPAEDTSTRKTTKKS
jgi:ArsR family transcriptional regulator